MSQVAGSPSVCSHREPFRGFVFSVCVYEPTVGFADRLWRARWCSQASMGVGVPQFLSEQEYDSSLLM